MKSQGTLCVYIPMSSEKKNISIWEVGQHSRNFRIMLKEIILHNSVSIKLNASISTINGMFVCKNHTLVLIIDVFPTHCMYARLSQIPAR